MLKEYFKYQYYIRCLDVSISVILLFILFMICVSDNPYYANLEANTLKTFYNNLSERQMDTIIFELRCAFHVFFIFKLNKINLQHRAYFIGFSIYTVLAYFTFKLGFLSETVFEAPIISVIPSILYFKYLISDMECTKGKKFLIGYTVFCIISEILCMIWLCYLCVNNNVSWKFILFYECSLRMKYVFCLFMWRELYHVCKQDDNYVN